MMMHLWKHILQQRNLQIGKQKDFWEVSRRNEIRGNVFGVIWGESNQGSISILYQNSPFKFIFYQSSLRHSFYVATFCIIAIVIVIYPLLSRRRFLHSFLTLPSSSPLRPLETFIWHSHHPPRPIHIEWNDHPKFSFTTITMHWFSRLVQLRYCYGWQPFGMGKKG